MEIFFKNEKYYELSMKSYIFKRLQAELYMKQKCISHHINANKFFECYYCKTNIILEEKKLDNELANIDYAIDLIDIIKKNMNDYLRKSDLLLDDCLYDV